MFIMLVGIPGSGKSTLAIKLAKKHKAAIHSSDSIRRELKVDVNRQDNNEEVFNTLHDRIKTDLAAGKSVIYDACNLSYRRRIAFLTEIRRYRAQTHCYVTAKSYQECLEDNRSRKRQVPEDVIAKMIRGIWIPQYYEGWHEINIVYTGKPIKMNTNAVFNRITGYHQRTKFHRLTLGAHMLLTQSLLLDGGKLDLSNSREDSLLHTAAMWHDMGKPFCQTFTNKKGKPSRNAHYYGHANAGAYEFMVMATTDHMPQESILGICQYIQWHMFPYNMGKNGRKKKFIGLVGQEFFDRLMLLNKADKEAQ
jgi:predicted kinase